MDDTSCACVIFDIDGTIANHDHRIHHLLKQPKDWDAFHAGIVDDPPHAPMVKLLTLLHNHFPTILCTGRQDDQRDATLEWLERHGIPHTELYMRTTNDHRPNAVVKKELMHTILAQGWRPLFVVEDQASVVKMWREAGLVCLQCAEGNF